MDILSYILAKKYTNKIAASSITSVTTEEDSEGNTWLVVVYNTSPTPTTIRYKIPTIAGRGISSVEITEDYKLKITYSDGTTWTSPQSIRGPKGDKGDKGDPGTASVSVSATGTSTNDVRYITIDGTESRFASVALRAMKTAWKTGTTAAAATAILNDDSVIAGDGFLATVYWTDLPGDVQQAEVKAFVLKKEGYQKIVQFECTSGTVSPYAWFYNSYEGVWRSYVPLNDTLTSTSTTAALTANKGKDLQDQVNNLKNIGRFLSILNCANGTVSTQPSGSVGSTYQFKVGDYYRVGAGGSYGPKALDTFTIDSTSGSSNFETGSETYAIGDVIYCSNVDNVNHTSTWAKQTASGGGTVQDVQINGTTIVASGTGIANITDGALSEVKYTAQSLTDAQKTQARTNISACAMQEYDSTAASYAENVLYYTTE